MKTILSNSTVQLVLIAALLVCGTIWVNNIKSDIKYMDIDCPVCGSSEVLDFGDDHRGMGAKGHCADCSTEFYVSPEFND